MRQLAVFVSVEVIGAIFILFIFDCGFEGRWLPHVIELELKICLLNHLFSKIPAVDTSKIDSGLDLDLDSYLD